MAYRERQKISQMTPKGADLELTDLLEVSTIEDGSYVTKSITGEEIINASGGALDLQAVTDNGNTTTNDVYAFTFQTGNGDTGEAKLLEDGSVEGAQLLLYNSNTTYFSKLKNDNTTDTDVVLQFPDKPNGEYTIATTADLTSGTVTSVDLTMPSAFSVSGNPVTTSGTLAVTGAGTVSQYVRGDGSLANFPSVSGGGASVNYYLNGSVNQGTFGGSTFYQMSKTPVLGGGTNFIRTNGAGNGYIASFITDANDPSFLNIPAGNWNLQFYFQSSSSGGSPQFYGEIYKVSVTNVFTLVASGSTNPEGITNGTTVDQYFTSIPVPQTSLLITDRLAIRIYVITGGRTITLHTENGNLCEVLTTFTTGLTALNGLTNQVQNFTTGTSGTDFGINSTGSTHTFNLPTASATNRGALSSTDWSAFNGKQNAITLTTTGTSGAATLVGSTLNIPTYAAGLTYFTEAQNTATPNATTPVDSLTAVSAATNADFAIIPKGNGAIIADIPDGLVTGGNKRGQYAVDLQMARLTNTAVASGNYSVISGGQFNTASNSNSSVGGGYQNTASGTASRVGGGIQNTASSVQSVVSGGANNSASAQYSTIGGGASCTATAYAASTLGGFGNTSTNSYASNLGGNSNTASGDSSTVLGGVSNASSGNYSISGGANSVANAIYGVALGGGVTTNSVMHRQVYGVRHSVTGDAQSSTFIMRMRTTNNTLTSFTSDGTTPSSTNQVILPNNGAFRFKGTIIGKQSASTNVAAWDIDGLIVRGASAATTTLLINNVTLIQNTPGWGTPSLAADTTAGGLRIYILGAAATNIQWVGDIKTTEVIYA